MRRVAVKGGTWRLVPTRHPPVQTFETVASPEDLEAVMELEGWTNDRLVRQRLARLPRERWVHGRANASVVMAAFLHASPAGARFSGPDLGAWYCALSELTAIAEVGHHLRQEVRRARLPSLAVQYRGYVARLAGRYHDLRGAAASHPELYDPGSWAASQRFGEALRTAGADGLVYDSVRHVSGTCIAAYDPRQVQQVTVGASFELTVPDAGKIVARRLS